jgi:hypothetical protein
MGSYAKIGAIVTILGIVILACTVMLTGILEVNDRIDEVVLEVDYFEHWNVTFSHDSIEESWSGMGRKETVLIRPSGSTWVISVEAEKVDESSGYLRVKIKLLDGTILKQAVTMLPYGKITMVLEIP